jgi:hypothetical protein
LHARKTIAVAVTQETFREIALSFAGAEERSHQKHPDFRAGGKIFATLADALRAAWLRVSSRTS